MRDLATPLGPVRLLALATADVAALHPDEATFAAGLPVRRQREWVAGRLALRSLVRDHHGIELPPILVAELGVPTLHVTHNPDEVRALANHAVHITGGKVAAAGAPDDVLASWLGS